MDIRLEKWDASYKKALIDICNTVDRQYLSNRMPYPYSEDDALFWLNYVTKKDGKNGIFRAVIVDGQCVGNISVEKKTDVYCKNAEIGYTLKIDSSSRGIMTEAVKQICKIAFEQLDIVRITAIVYNPNIASKRVLEKNGFVLEGVLKNGIYKDGNIYDECIFGKLKS